MIIFSFRIFIQLTLVLIVGLLVGCVSNDEALVRPTPKPNPMSIEDNYSIENNSQEPFFSVEIDKINYSPLYNNTIDINR